jgi:hypothetical protein
MNDTELKPNISVGPIKLGDNIEKYFRYKHIYFKKDVADEYMEDYYEFMQPPLIVFINGSGEVTTINCHVECFWKSKNLIGLSIRDFIKLSKKKPDSHEKVYVLTDHKTGQTQDVYSFEDLGVQIWGWKNKIVTVSCTNYNSP